MPLTPTDWKLALSVKDRLLMIPVGDFKDSLAAYSLYMKSVEWKEAGIFEQKLEELYEYGQKCDWKLGVDDS